MIIFSKRLKGIYNPSKIFIVDRRDGFELRMRFEDENYTLHQVASEDVYMKLMDWIMCGVQDSIESMVEKSLEIEQKNNAKFIVEPSEVSIEIGKLPEGTWFHFVGDNDVWYVGSTEDDKVNYGDPFQDWYDGRVSVLTMVMVKDTSVVSKP